MRNTKGILVELLGSPDLRRVLAMVSTPTWVNKQELLSKVLEEQEEELVIDLMHVIALLFLRLACLGYFKHILNLKLKDLINSNTQV